METNNSIVLSEYQMEHAMRLKNILKKNHVALDFSETGTGKTYVSTWLVNQVSGASMIVICPKSVRSKWEYEIKEFYQNKIKEIINFESLGGIVGNQPNHGYLVRRDTVLKDTGEGMLKEEVHTTFEPSVKLVELLEKETIIFVFDEEHKAKNESIRYKATRAIMKAVLENGRSRAILMTATPADKIEHVERLMKVIGIINKYSVMGKTTDKGEFILLGIREVIDEARKYNREATDKYLKLVGKINKENYRTVIFRLFVDRILPNISSRMIMQDDPSIKQLIYNHYYNCPDDEKDIIISLINDFNGKIMFFNPAKGSEDVIKGTSFKYIMDSLFKIERAKKNIFIRESRRILEKYPKAKVVIFLKLREVIKDVSESLNEYNPLVLIGDKTYDQRLDILKKFNSTDLNYRLLIANLDLASEGIDLDDKNGNHPRVVFCIPSFDIFRIHQMIGRFKRNGTKSSSVINFVYVASDIKEIRILKALSRKTEILKEVISEKRDLENRDIRFPDEYETLIDP